MANRVDFQGCRYSSLLVTANLIRCKVIVYKFTGEKPLYIIFADVLL